MEACDHRQFPVFLTLMLTGLRPGELTHLLLPDDLDLANRLLHSHRMALNTALSEYTRCGASSRTKARYGARKAHSSSVTSLGEAVRGLLIHTKLEQHQHLSP
ncbi:hypothetical protein [Planctomicrobium piriforme]|uniref:Phage integrase family protein n=1 Tax=Planctomicrobium piriforme TaxID=1576369 RepID=A0A1I3GIM5_9PLAN|nr:hypothetical protein SAMN05421753_10710 [Planctomicrobium piriforme]